MPRPRSAEGAGSAGRSLLQGLTAPLAYRSRAQVWFVEPKHDTGGFLGSILAAEGGVRIEDPAKKT